MNISRISRRELLHSLLLVQHCMTDDDTSRHPIEYEATKEKKRKKEKMKRKSFSILRGHELNVVLLGNLARSMPYTRQWWIDDDRYSPLEVKLNQTKTSNHIPHYLRLKGRRSLKKLSRI